jgi:hypothetical protein
MVQQISTNAAREGVRRVVLDGATSDGRDGVLNEVTEYLNGTGIGGCECDGQPRLARFRRLG